MNRLLMNRPSPPPPGPARMAWTESSPMDDLKEDAKDTLLPSEGTADTKQSTMTGTISDIKDFMFTITADGTD